MINFNRRHAEDSMRGTMRWAVVGLGLVSSVSTLRAQRAVDARFQPWVGCWATVGGEQAAPQPAGAAVNAPEQRPSRACVVPSARVPGSIDVQLYVKDSLVSSVPIPMPGTTSAREIDDCTGTETSEFLANDTRLVLRADLTCARGIKRVETGLMSIAPSGEWMQLQHQQVANNAATTVARLRFDPEASARLAALKGVTTSSSAMRLGVGGTVTSLQVLAVSKAVPVALAEAYVAELGLQFSLDGKALAQLADAGMPPRVIDLMVAMAHPNTFQVGPARSTMGMSANDPNAPVVSASMREPSVRRSSCSTLDEFCYGAGGMGAWGMGWGYGYGYGLDPWGYPYAGMRARYPYGMMPYGYGYGYGYPYGFGYGYPVYYGNGPVIIVNRPSTGDNNGSYGGSVPGRAVNGGGYTRGNVGGGAGGGSGTTGTSRTVSPSGGSSGGVGAGAGGGASGGAAGGSAGGGEARTAKPRGGG